MKKTACAILLLLALLLWSAMASAQTLKEGTYMVGVDIPEGNYIVTSHKDNPAYCTVCVFEDADGDGEFSAISDDESLYSFTVLNPSVEFFDEDNHLSEYRASLHNGESLEILFGKAIFEKNPNAVVEPFPAELNLNEMSLEELKTLLQDVRIAIAKKERSSRSSSEPEETYGELNYKQVARIPENFMDDKVQFKGTVLQVQGSRADGYNIRIATSENQYDDIVFLYAPPESLENMNILEGDRLNVKATLKGEYTYTAVLGNEITLPLAYADKVSIILYESSN